ncbi:MULTISPECIES: DUF6691 family protein [Paenalcaligenes]|uniref:Membrane protein n=1 Tax=Paenalcaligenes hermetiae TaxID=1157987 RepID=A0ABP9M607_9BURK|nr:DUF6691 family protein [Paenalcaligenes sp.]
MMMIVGGALAGLLFGLGLLISGLAHPDKVQSFLDLAGNWDPSLAFVMGGAIAVAIVPFTLAKKDKIQPISGVQLALPKRTDIDKKLLIGSALFGVGWGLAGYCPGPVLVSFGAGIGMAWWFLPAMVVGIWIQRQFFNK